MESMHIGSLELCFMVCVMPKGKSMKGPHVFDMKFHKLLRGTVGMAWDEMSHLGQTISKDIDGIESSGGW